MSRPKLSVLVALLVALLLLPSCVTLAEDQPTPTPIPTPSESNKPTYTVTKGTIVQTVQALGRVAASQEATLFFREAGRMRRVYVETNQKVKAGDVLAELETGDLQTQIDQATINLDIAQIKLAQAEDQAGTSTALAQAQAQLNAAQLGYTKAKNDLASLTTPASAGDIAAAQQKVDQAKMAVTKAENDYNAAYQVWFHAKSADKAQAQSDLNVALLAVTAARNGRTAAQAALDQLRAGPKASDVTAAQQAVNSAKASLDAAQAGYNNVVETQGKGGDYNVQIAEKQVELARAALQILMDQLELAQIKAPFDGIVTEVNGSDGDDVKAYTAIVTVSNPTSLQVAVELQATDLTKVQLKQPAQIVFTSYPAEKISGTVVYLPSLSASADATLPSDQRTVRLDFTPPPNQTLDLGSLANVTITTQQKDNVLILPNNAIRTFGGRQFVRLVAPGGRNQEVDIEVGISNDTDSEIVKGLREGQVVIGQ